MENLSVHETARVSGGGVSFGEAIAMGSFAGGTGAAVSGASMLAIGSATIAGGLIVGAGYAGYSLGNAFNLGSYGTKLGITLYDVFDE